MVSASPSIEPLGFIAGVNSAAPGYFKLARPVRATKTSRFRHDLSVLAFTVVKVSLPCAPARHDTGGGFFKEERSCTDAQEIVRYPRQKVNMTFVTIFT